MLNMDYEKLMKIVKFQSDDKFKKDVKESFLLMIGFGIIFVGIVNLQISYNFLWYLLFFVAILIRCWGSIIKHELCHDQYFLFNGVTMNIVSISCLGTSTAIYYLYLNHISTWFITLLIVFYAIVMACSIWLINFKAKQTLDNNEKSNALVLYGSIGALGVVFGQLLIIYMSQNALRVTAVILFAFLGYLFEWIGWHSILEYIIVKNYRTRTREGTSNIADKVHPKK